MKLEMVPFSVEDVIADCMELLLPLVLHRFPIRVNRVLKRYISPGSPEIGNGFQY